MSETPDPVARINALTTNARNTWFVLLGVLVFVAITLMGVQHIDFYGVDRATALPLVNVSVPTWLFFYAAPLLITAVYGYFHLYLIRLWDALGDADPIINGTRLGDAITPWLVSDVALKLRATYRDPTCITPRAMEIPNAIWNTLFAWIAGPAILGWLWWASMPARDWVMTGLAGTCLLFSLAFGYASVAMMRRRMQAQAPTSHRVWHDSGALPALVFLLMPAVALLTHSRTVDSSDWIKLARIDLAGAALVEKPADWLPYDVARKDFLAVWCDREAIDDCNQLRNRQEDFDVEWNIRRTAALSALKKPRWSTNGAAPVDFREADLTGAFLSGSFLLNADLKSVKLRQAQLEGAILVGAHLDGANLSEAQLQKADFIWAKMEGSDFSHAQMQGAVLFGTQMQWANLSEAQMQGAILREAQMQGANLSRAQMQGADLSTAQMQGADLSWVQMQGANLYLAQLQGTNLFEALLTGSPENPKILSFTALSASTNKGSALRNVHLRSASFDTPTDWRNAFLDASVTISEELRTQMGDPCQWKWASEYANGLPLDDEQFFALWRGWVEIGPVRSKLIGWTSFAPPEWRDVPAIPPPEGCTWQTGPLPGAVSQE